MSNITLVKKERVLAMPDKPLSIRWKYRSGDELLVKTREFFEIEEAKGDKAVITLAGLRLHLGISTDTWSRYGRMEEFADIIDWAKSKIVYYLEGKLLNSGKPVGAIFALKAQHGWTDQPKERKTTNNYVYVFGNEVEALKDKERHLSAVQRPQITQECEVVEMKTPTRKRRGRPKGSKSKIKVDPNSKLN